MAFPTETVYGLGGNAYLHDSARAIFAAKGRPSDNPLIVHIPSLDRISQVCGAVDPVSQILAEALWPGPLTLVLPKSPSIPGSVTGGLATVGVRIPDDPTAMELLRFADVPVAAPSANTSGRPSPTAFWMVQRDLSGRIDGIVKGPDTRIGLESTILRVDQGSIFILRPGAIGVDQIRQVLDEAGMSAIPLYSPSDGTPEHPERMDASHHQVPGSRYRHYSPSIRVRRFTDSASLAALLQDELNENPDLRFAILTTQRFSTLPLDGQSQRVVVYADLDHYARQLYRDMVQLESEDYQLIILHYPSSTVFSPQEGGIQSALQDRIRRACADE